MAEGLGLAASVIAVADLTGKTIALSVKLKSLWEEVKDVPVTLLEKAEHLQYLDELLCEAEKDAADDSMPSFIWDAINRARYAKDDVQDTIDAHREELANKRRHRRKIAAAKIVIQKDSLRMVERKFDRALDLYKFAHIIAYGRYNMLIYKRLTESSSAFTISTANHSSYVDSGDSASDAATQMVKMKAARPMNNAIFEGRSIIGRICFGVYDQSYSFSMRTPDWFGERIYSTMVQRSIVGWQASLSVYPIVDFFEDKVYDMIRGDDINILLQYLCENNLTPLVHDRDGANLLHLAMYYESIEIIKQLLSCGLDPGSFSEWALIVEGMNPVHMRTMGIASSDAAFVETPLTNSFHSAPVNLYFGIYYIAQRTKRCRLDVIKLCQDYMRDTVESDDYIWTILPQERSFEDFTAMQMTLAPRYLAFNMRDRHLHASIGVMRSNWNWCEVQTLLPEAEILTQNPVANCDYSVLNSLAVPAALGMGRDLASLHSRKSVSPVNCSFYQVLSDMFRLQLEDSRLSCDSTELSQRSMMVCLWLFLHGLLRSLDWHSPEVLDQILQSSILHWATMLYSSDVDLLHHGRKLRDLCEDLRWPRKPIQDEPGECISKRHPYICSFLGITYGSMPTQWKLWWSPNDNNYAADFWNLVEDSEVQEPVFNVPGGWEDYFDDGDYGDADNEDDQKSSFICSEYRKIKPPV